MQNLSRPSATDNPLVTLLRAWERRRRLQHTVYWLAGSLIPGLTLAVTAGLLSRMRPMLSNTEILALALAGAVVGLIALLGWAWLWPRPQMHSARFFDRHFGLQERLATALELREGRIRASEAFRQHQLEDTYQHVAAVDACGGLPLRIRRLDWLAVVLLIVLLLPLVLLPNDLQSAGDPDSAQQQQIVAEAADEIRDTIEDVAAESALTEEDRRQLLETLQADLETLQNEQLSMEEALATLNDAAGMLSERAGELQNNIEAQQEALQAAADKLNDSAQSPADSSDPTQASPSEQAANSLDEAAQSLDQMTEQQRQNLAQALQEAADALQEVSPQTADLMREAAEALERGDLQAAQEALERAADAIREGERQQQNLQELAQQLQERAEQLQELQRMMDEEPPPPGEEGGSEEESEQGQAAGQSGEQSAQSAPGDSDSDEMRPGNTFAEESQPGETGSLQTGDVGSAESDQVGTMPGQLDQDTSGFEASGEQPDGGGSPGREREYEAVFAPRRPDLETGGDEIFLESDSGDAPLIEGNFGDNPIGDVTVPYNEVFGSYAGAANRALDQGYIPLGLRDVVRDYFTSLAPRGSQPRN